MFLSPYTQLHEYMKLILSSSFLFSIFVWMLRGNKFVKNYFFIRIIICFSLFFFGFPGMIIVHNRFLETVCLNTYHKNVY